MSEVVNEEAGNIEAASVDTESTEAAKVEDAVAEPSAEATKLTDITLNVIFKKLSEKVTAYNAKLLLNHAIVLSGVKQAPDTPLNQEMAKSICLELCKKGGPSFQVGKNLYNTFSN